MTGDNDVVVNLMQVGDDEKIKQDQYLVEFQQVCKWVGRSFEPQKLC